MLIDSGNVAVLCGKGKYEYMKKLKRFPVFSELVCNFLDDLSSIILKTPEARNFPDVITFGFFCRRGNIQFLKKKYSENGNRRLGRGVSFHIAPSNVPVNFAYSMIAALLAGNSCIIRASSKSFRQTDIICECMNSLFEKEEYCVLSDYINVVKYSHNKEVTDYFSSICDIRIIWGGDNTISEIRKSEISPRVSEITFADRYSIAVFDAESVLKYYDIKNLAADFYNDTYLFDQNACSSPRMIYWLGNKEVTEKASERFWNAVYDILEEKNYSIKPVTAVDKYTAACRAAIDLEAHINVHKDNRISRIRIENLSENVPDYRSGSGSFIEYADLDLNTLAGIVTDKFQTVSYFGLDRNIIFDYVYNNGLCGIDRIVPVGKTTDFSLVWDGIDLIFSMSRIIN